MNKCMFVGRVARDPEATDNIVTFPLAVRRNFKNKDGDYDTDFVRIKAFGSRKPFVESYVKKGDIVSVSARYQPSSFVNNDNQTIYTHDFMLEEIGLFSAPKTQVENNPSEEPQFEAPVGQFDVSDDDLPF